MSGFLSYRDAGVDIVAGDRLVDRIKPLAAATRREGLIAGIGGFGSLFEIPKRYQNPVLVSGTDGVGTKLKLAFAWNMHDTVGIDLVAMSVNDILVQGAEPLFFLDYFACGRLNVDEATRVVAGIAKGCEQAQCALVGGETAEMPGMYPEGEYDLAGFAVGVVEKDRIIDGRSIQAGDVVLGLASSGVHSNGYSMVRRVLANLSSSQIENINIEGKSLREQLMTPTRIYVKSILSLLQKMPVKGIAHITGGGLPGNVPRVLPPNTRAVLDRSTWQLPPVMSWLQSTGPISDEEMLTTFNCGIGLVLLIDPARADEAITHLEAMGEKVYRIGYIETTHGVSEADALRFV